MSFYWIQHSSHPQHAYAYKDASFVGFYKSICPSCKRAVSKMEYKESGHRLLVEGGCVYPDLMQFCGVGNSLFLISERTLNLFEQHHISGYRKYTPVALEYLDDNRIQASTKIPNYFCLDISGTIELDFYHMQLKKKRICPTCGQFEWNRQRFSPMLVDPSSWSGSDLCAVSDMNAFKVCTKQLTSLIRSKKLVGFSFQTAIKE